MEELKNIGSLAQLGSFGIVSYIVYWALKNVPKWMEDNRNLRETEITSREAVAVAHREAVAQIITSYEKTAREQLDRHDTQMRMERDTCERRHQELIASVNRGHEEEREAREAQHREVMERIRIIDHTVRDVAQSRANAEALTRARRGNNPPLRDKEKEAEG